MYDLYEIYEAPNPDDEIINKQPKSNISSISTSPYLGNNNSSNNNNYNNDEVAIIEENIYTLPTRDEERKNKLINDTEIGSGIYTTPSRTNEDQPDDGMV